MIFILEIILICQVTDRHTTRFLKILEELTGAFKQADVAEDISIDETMIPYFGKHGTKQFIREKPIRRSFNLWYLRIYMYHVKSYICVSRNPLVSV